MARGMREAKRQLIVEPSLVVVIGRAPRFRCSRATRRAAFEWHGESFRDQDFAHVATGRFQRSAIPAVVASGRPLRSGWTRASDKLKIEIAGPNKFTHSPRRLVA